MKKITMAAAILMMLLALIACSGSSPADPGDPGDTTNPGDQEEDSKPVQTTGKLDLPSWLANKTWECYGASEGLDVIYAGENDLFMDAPTNSLYNQLEQLNATWSQKSEGNIYEISFRATQSYGTYTTTMDAVYTFTKINDETFTLVMDGTVTGTMPGGSVNEPMISIQTFVRR